MNQDHFSALDADWESSDLFDEREKSVIRWARALTRNTARDDDAAFEGMRTHFSEQEIVELTLFTCLFNAWNRLQDGFRNELEPPEGRISWSADWETEGASR